MSNGRHVSSPAKTYRVAQNSNVPFPFPIRVSFPFGFVNGATTLKFKKHSTP